MSDSVRSKIQELENEYSRTQKNKATSGHLGLIKAKLAKLKRELLEADSGGRGGGGGGGGRGFDVSKAGDTRVGFVGFPSVGKSTLLTRLTGTFSEAAAYEFTTLTAVPGTLHYRGARIQMLDLPGIIEGAKDGKGRGRQVISTARTCNMLLICLDVAKSMTHKKIIERELDGFGIRLNQKPPDIVFRKKDKGGLNYQEMVPQRSRNGDPADTLRDFVGNGLPAPCTWDLITTFSAACLKSELSHDVVLSVLREYRLHSCDVILRDDCTIDQFIDVVEGNRKYMPALYVMNKIDQVTIEELDIICQIPHHVVVSAHHGWNIDELLEMVWDYCNMIRIYTKPKGQIPDYNEPVILHDTKPSMEQFCNRIHKDILTHFKYAWVWGSSVKHQPQKTGKDHRLNDEDVVQIVKKI